MFLSHPVRRITTLGPKISNTLEFETDQAIPQFLYDGKNDVIYQLSP
jgi:hypothetical protein